MKPVDHIALTEEFSAHNYAPLDVVLSEGEGAWVRDVEGRRYLDLLSGYSALNFGHRHPRLIAAARAQLDRLTLTSRAFYNDKLGLLCRDLAVLCGLDSVLLMNSGAEAVETAIKASRKWGYEVKGVPPDEAEIICCSNNFSGRTTTIISFSTSPSARRGFGPFTPGFIIGPYGDAAGIDALMTPRTVAVIVEPIQGEAGIIVPPAGFLRDLRQLCTDRAVLFVADEIQTGLCRTGEVFACDHEQVKPDLYILAKSLGGGIVPISAVVGRGDVMSVFTPGTHGSTFGGNPLACAIALEVLALIREERPHLRARELGDYFLGRLRAIPSDILGEIRGRGLFVGADIRPAAGTAKHFCHLLKDEGLLCKDTREQTIRFAPPLVISREDLDHALAGIERVFRR